MNRLYAKLYEVMLIILGIGTVYCFVMSIFEKKAVYDYNSLILVIGIFVYIGMVCLAYQWCKKFTDSQLNYIIIILLAMYLILTLIFGLRIKSARPNDLINLHNAAISYLQTGKIANVDYFSSFPMQLNYTYILILVYKMGSLFGITDYRTSGTLFGVIILFLSAVLVYKIAEKIKDKHLGTIALLVFSTNPVFWIYSSYYYTDLPGMLFILVSIYIALCVNEKNRKGFNLFLCVLMGMVVFAGYKMRATVAIGGIAVLVLGIIVFNNNKDKMMLVRNFIAFCAGCILALIGYKAIESYFNIELDRNMELPIVYWILTGLGEENSGVWSASLRKYVDSFPTYDEKVAGCIEGIKLSLSDMGILGFLKLILKKMVIMWSDGMTALTTNFVTAVHYGPLYEYTIGNKKAVTCYSTQIMRSSLLLCTIPYIFYEIKNKFSRKSLLIITFFGYMLFYFIWEVNEKYALMFLPLLIVIAVYGIHLIIEKLNSFQQVTITGNTEYVFDKRKLYDILKKINLCVIIVTIFLSIFSWNDMVIKEEKKYNFVVFQSSTSSSIQVSNTAISQTFLAKSKFNAIYVKFLNNEVPNEQKYVFSLYDENNVCIYQEDFYASNIGDNVYHAFVFDKIEVNEYHEFHFEIMANDEYENTLEVCSAGNSYADYYTRGECRVANESRGDMTFRIYYMETAGYYSKAFYILMILIILLLESIIFVSIHVDKLNIRKIKKK